MSEYYVVEEYSDRDLNFSESVGLIPIGRVVNIVGIIYEPPSEDWYSAVEIAEVSRNEAEPFYMTYYFKVKLRPVDPLTAFGIIAKQHEHEGETK